MQIKRANLLKGAREAQGTVVVIDVLRAFSTAAVLLHLGAEKLILTAEAEAVLRLKKEADCLAVGEVHGRMVPGFDFGNSPSQLLAAGRDAVTGRAVALRSSAGTTGAVAASQSAEQLILGSLVTAGAIVRYLHQQKPPIVTLLAMGNGGMEPSPDDEFCADVIEHQLTGQPFDYVSNLQRVVNHQCTQKFLRGDKPHFPPADPLFCLQRDLFDFVIVAELKNDRVLARPVIQPKTTRS